MAFAGETIADAIEKLRIDLSEAIERGKNQNLSFSLETIELELSVAGEWSAETGFSFKVFGIGGTAKGGGKRTGTHKLKLILKPKVKTKDKESESPTISRKTARPTR